MPSWLRMAGLCLAGGGLAWATWAAWVSGDTLLADPDRPIRGGPYAVGRNPMYVGWTLLHLGVGLVARSPWVLAAWPMSFALVHRSVLHEERLILEQ